jgi:hypothetical protein
VALSTVPLIVHPLAAKVISSPSALRSHTPFNTDPSQVDAALPLPPLLARRSVRPSQPGPSQPTIATAKSKTRGTRTLEFTGSSDFIRVFPRCLHESWRQAAAGTSPILFVPRTGRKDKGTPWRDIVWSRAGRLM